MTRDSSEQSIYWHMVVLVESSEPYGKMAIYVIESKQVNDLA